jgi:hypothetical protein
VTPTGCGSPSILREDKPGFPKSATPPPPTSFTYEASDPTTFPRDTLVLPGQRSLLRGSTASPVPNQSIKQPDPNATRTRWNPPERVLCYVLLRTGIACRTPTQGTRQRALHLSPGAVSAVCWRPRRRSREQAQRGKWTSGQRTVDTPLVDTRHAVRPAFPPRQ